MYRRAEPTDTYGKPVKYSEDGSAYEVSKKKRKRKEGACGYLTKNVGKFTEEAVFTPSAFLQGQRT